MDCRNCKFADWDYEEYYGGTKQWFVCGCQKDLDIEDGDTCDGFEEEDEEEDW